MRYRDKYEQVMYLLSDKVDNAREDYERMRATEEKHPCADCRATLRNKERYMNTLLDIWTVASYITD
jgi:hypothetical protein